MKIFYIHIPKTGGVSIHTALKKSGNQGSKEQHFFIKTYQKPINIPTLAVVRNPFDRAYSLYEFYKKKRTTLNEVPSWEFFISNFDKLNGIMFNPCFNFMEIDGKIVIENIIRFENLESDYDNFCKKFSIENKLEHLNKNDKKDLKSKDEIYTIEQRGLIYKYFEKDFEHFDYSYNDWVNTSWR